MNTFEITHKDTQIIRAKYEKKVEDARLALVALENIDQSFLHEKEKEVQNLKKILSNAVGLIESTYCGLRDVGEHYDISSHFSVLVRDIIKSETYEHVYAARVQRARNVYIEAVREFLEFLEM